MNTMEGSKNGKSVISTGGVHALRVGMEWDFVCDESSKELPCTPLSHPHYNVRLDSFLGVGPWLGVHMFSTL